MSFAGFFGASGRRAAAEASQSIQENAKAAAGCEVCTASHTLMLCSLQCSNSAQPRTLPHCMQLAGPAALHVDVLPKVLVFSGRRRLSQQRRKHCQLRRMCSLEPCRIAMLRCFRSDMRLTPSLVVGLVNMAESEHASVVHWTTGLAVCEDYHFWQNRCISSGPAAKSGS